MSFMAAKRWCIRLLPVSLLLLCLSYYYCAVFIQRTVLTPAPRAEGVDWLLSTGTVSPEDGGVEGVISSTPPTKQCDGWFTSEKWESLHFNVSRNLQLFLQLKNVFCKPYLSEYPLPYGVKGSEFLLMNALAAIASYDMPENIQNMPCRTCVVIGNGFNIKNTSLGSVIDGYDIVIRLNDAPVRGYEGDVGKKTTVRLFYPESAPPHPERDSDTLMILVPFKVQDVNWIKQILYKEKTTMQGFWKPPPQNWVAETGHIRILDPYFLRETASRLLGLPLRAPPGSNQAPPYPTTGMLAIFLALNYCDKVHVAGFGYPDTKDTRHPVHYYGYQTMMSMKDSVHSLSLEAKALKRLEECGAVTYLHPHS